MNALPSISSQIDEDKIFKIINKNFSKIAPSYYNLITSWLSRSYNVFQDIDKFVILIYFINKDLIFFRKNGLVINYDTFYNDKSIEIPKINISDISNDLKIPKESVRRKLQELEKKGIIKKTGKKIFVDRSAFTTAKAEQTLKELSILISKFNEILVEEKVTNIIFNTNEISESIKTNFSFCWYQFYKFLFIYTTRWRNNVTDLETLAIGLVVLLNTIDNKSFRAKDLNRKKYFKLSQGSDDIGVNAMSLSDITGIPRPTVVRKLRYLIKNNFLHIDEKKLITLNITGAALKKTNELQDLNMKNLSNFLYRIFNQIKIINS
ncbi:MarR family transcriptional regulator [Candidatus Pelagibacter bacterium]|jgi:CRP-like cAMP-binding protein|nr:MarR family transcriptional regulator [Candidatus Pelagibacter bacterium]MDA9232600.1 MarR family transcriptional regulator [Candidatus Pelagibacter sp.]